MDLSNIVLIKNKSFPKNVLPVKKMNKKHFINSKNGTKSD